MSKRRETKLVRDVRRCLKLTGLAYEIVSCSKHYQIYLLGECIGVLSHGIGPGVDGRNLMMIINKKAREHADRERAVQGAGAARLQGDRD